MMYKKRVILFLMISNMGLLAIRYGTDSRITIFSKQISLRNKDEVRSGAVLEGGCKANGIGTVDMNSNFPVSGNISCNGLTFNLGKDLKTNKKTNLLTLNNIEGNGNAFSVASSVATMPDDQMLHFIPVQRINESDVSVHTNDWSSDGKYFAAGLVDNVQKDIVQFFSFDEDGYRSSCGTSNPLSFFNSDTPNGASVSSVRWRPDRLQCAVATTGAKNEEELYMYTVNEIDNTIGITAAVFIADALTVEQGKDQDQDICGIAWHPTGNFLVVGVSNTIKNLLIVYLVDEFGMLSLASVLDVGSQKIQLQAISFDNTGSLLAVGFSQGAASELRIFDFNIETNALQYAAGIEFSVGVSALDWHTQIDNHLVVGLHTGSINDQIQLYQYNNSTNNITLVDSFDFNYNGDIISLQFNVLGDKLAIGINPSQTTSEFLIISFDQIVKTFEAVLYNESLGSCVNSVRWRMDSSFISIGSALNGTFDPDTIHLYGFEIADIVTYNNVRLLFNNNIKMNPSCITFSGDTSINANGFLLTMDELTRFVVDKNSTLTLKNVTITGVMGTNIFLTDDTSAIHFDNVTLVLKDDFILANGLFTVKNNCIVIGNGNRFTFSTDQACLVKSKSCLKLKENTIFSYQPSIEKNNLLQFENKTAGLSINSSTIEVLDKPLNFLKGTLVVKGNSFLSSYIENAPGFIFGNKKLKMQNMDIFITQAASLELLNGIVQYANV